MMIKLFPHKGPSASAVNYCLSDYDHKGNLREVKPEILLGDAEYTKSLDSIAKKATSGVIAFRDNEKPTKEQMLEIVEKFEKTFIGTELREKVNCLYIIHKEKGSTEIHFVINNIVLDEKQKAFNPFPPHHEKLKDAFVAKINDEMGYEQIIEKDLLKKNKTLSNAERKALDKGHHGFYNLSTKKALEATLFKAVASKEIKNRKELISFIKNELGLELSRVSDNYLSIKSTDPSKKNIRLSGGIFSTNDNQAYADIQKQMREKAKQPFNLNETNKAYLREMSKKVAYNKKRFGTIDDARGYDTTLSTEQIKTAEKEVSNIKRLNTARKQSKEIAMLGSLQQPQEQKNIAQTSSNEATKDSSQQTSIEHNNDQLSNITSSDLVLSNTAEQQLASAVAQLNNAKTPEQHTAARLAVSKAQLAVLKEKAANEDKKNKALEQLELLRKIQINKPKI